MYRGDLWWGADDSETTIESSQGNFPSRSFVRALGPIDPVRAFGTVDCSGGAVQTVEHRRRRLERGLHEHASSADCVTTTTNQTRVFR